MHPTSQAIQQIIQATPGYSVDVLASDLGLGVKAENDPYMKPREAAAYLNISLRWLFELRRTGKVKWYEISSRLRFKKSDLENLITKGGQRDERTIA